MRRGFRSPGMRLADGSPCPAPSRPSESPRTPIQPPPPRSVMDYASGGSLFDYVQARKRLKESVARWFFQQLVFACDYCHRKVRTRTNAHTRLRSRCRRAGRGTGDAWHRWVRALGRPGLGRVLAGIGGRCKGTGRGLRSTARPNEPRDANMQGLKSPRGWQLAQRLAHAPLDRFEFRAPIMRAERHTSHGPIERVQWRAHAQLLRV
jgi:hypothetical protein